MPSTRSLSQLLSQRHPIAIDGTGDRVGAGRSAPMPSGLGDESPIMALAQARLQAEQEWLGGIAALVKLLLHQPTPQTMGSVRLPLGVVLSGPFPVLPDRLMGRPLFHWLLVPEPLERILSVARPLLPGQVQGAAKAPACDLQMVPLATEDPLAQERFCLLLTPDFSLSLVLGDGGEGQPAFQYSFDPETAEQVWGQLRDRIARARPSLLPSIDQTVDQFPPVAPDYRLVTQYGHLLMRQLRQQAASAPAMTTPTPASPVQFAALELPAAPALAAAVEWPGMPSSPANGAEETAEPAVANSMSSDAELLKAMAHEIRTPLTTIRTLTRSLLKRKDVTGDVAKRLRLIDRECTQQIDRFNLIFRAVELETEATKHPKSPLSAISLNQLFQDAIPLWQQQASRRNLTLSVDVPPQLPMVTSDSIMLNQVLTGLIDRFTHSLPPYSHIELAVTLAGHQLKLQFQSHPPDDQGGEGATEPVDTLLATPFKALGQLLIFQPETGGLSLNLQATKNLFQSLGGKLIVRQRPKAGEVLTVFLPLESRTL